MTKNKSKLKDDGYKPIKFSKVDVLSVADPKRFDCYVDRAENALNKSVDDLVIKKTWTLPLGFCFTFLLAILTSNFKQFLGIDGRDWRTLFIFLLFVSVCWSVSWAYKAFRARKTNVTQIIERMRGDDN